MDAQLGQRLEHVVAQLAGDAVPGQLDVPEKKSKKRALELLKIGAELCCRTCGPACAARGSAS